jgi:transcriptional regulator with XRE-family HTH domain
LVEPPTATTTAPLATLARRLRELRHSGFANAKLTQGDIARALSVAVSTLSTWENVQRPTLPSHRHLASYARFFSTDRSLEGATPHLIPLEELSVAENEARNKLERELFRLRDNDADKVSTARQSWRFEDGAPITVICSELSMSNQVKLGPLSDVDNPNYTELYSYGDLDALVELLSYLHSSNPDSPINFCLASQVTRRELVNHIVLLGGIAWNDATRRLNASAKLPVRQVQSERIHSGEVFEIDGKPDHAQQFVPRWQDDNPGTQEKPGVLLEDVAMLARLPNPYNVLRTLTYCNGVHSRGVLGAVRCLTDEDVRDDNESYLEEAFFYSDRFVVLMRVLVMGGQTISPTLKNPGAILFQWPVAEHMT